MAIYLHTDHSQKLADALYEAIDDGDAPTWTYDDDKDFTHSPPQWANKAWLRPDPQDGGLVLTMVCPKGETITSEIYAVYHGRFVEFALNHADQLFTKAEISAQAGTDDVVE